jgi:hypothetical protein
VAKAAGAREALRCRGVINNPKREREVKNRSEAWKSVAVGVLIAAAMVSEAAMAQTTGGTSPSLGVAGPSLAGGGITIGQISANIVDSLKGAAQVITALAYLGAVTFGWIGMLKWKAHGEQPDRTPMKVPVTYWAIAAGCAALPEFIGTGIATLWGASPNLVTPI